VTQRTTRWRCQTHVRYAPDVADLTDPHELERLRRSVAMLTPGVLALRREDALQLLAEVQRLRERGQRVSADLRQALADLERQVAQLEE